jgi:hypothetical protein
VLSLAGYLCCHIALCLLPPLSLFGASTGAAETFYDLAPESIWLHGWQLSSQRFPQFCLGLCTNEEFRQ